MIVNEEKVLAIVCAKEESSRFPNKNRALINDVITRLLDLSWLNKIVLGTDDNAIKEPVDDKMVRIDRPKNACMPEDSVFNVARWVYYNLNEEYDYIILVLPNVVNFKTSYVGKALRLLIKENLNEVRTYSKEGPENGVIVMKKDWFLNGTFSVYCGHIVSKAKEIHYESELNDDSN